MKTLIRHLAKTNAAEIVSKSLLHCHARNVHSVMLLACPEKTIRLFVAEPGHELWKNTSELWGKPGLSVGFHAHHCELTIVPVVGKLWNWQVKVSDRGNWHVGEFAYQSAISGNGASFKRVASRRVETVSESPIPKGSGEYMPADQMHTVSCAKDSLTAWLVYEGREDRNYHPVTLANVNLERFDFSGMYQRTNEAGVRRLLMLAQLL